MKECLIYDKFGEEGVRCRACHHFCRIRDGAVGICGVRQNNGGKLYSLVYGKAAAVHIDPIEKKPLFHFLPGSLTFSFGTVGCNFRCANCHNYEISQIFGKKGKMKEYPKLSFGYDLSPSEIVGEALRQGCASISYTYNEPTIFVEYALETMKLARKKGLKNVWVSNGYMTDDLLDLIIPHLDAINVDLKSTDEGFYSRNCGGQAGPIMENCQRLVESGVWLEITTLLIPKLSDDQKMLAKLATFIRERLGKDVPWHISAFSGIISWKLRDYPDTPPEAIERAYQLGKKAGLENVYGGNVWGSDLENTLCPECGTIVIERIGYEVVRHDKKGKCPTCGQALAGTFS